MPRFQSRLGRTAKETPESILRETWSGSRGLHLIGAPDGAPILLRIGEGRSAIIDEHSATKGLARIYEIKARI